MLSCIALASCLADIPELTGTSSSTGSGGATGSSSAVTSTVATGWCAEQDSSIEHCADFDEVAGPAEGWGGAADFGVHGGVELSMDRFTSEPRSMHAWVEDDTPGAGGGPACERAQVRKEFLDDPAPVVEAAFDVWPVGLEGIVADLSWDHEGQDCVVLVRYYADHVHLSLYSWPDPTDTMSAGVDFFHDFDPWNDWHRVTVTWDRAASMPSFGVRFDGMSPTEPAFSGNASNWWAACNTAVIDGPLTFSVGSYCVGPDDPTDAYFDNVTFDFR